MTRQAQMEARRKTTTGSGFSGGSSPSDMRIKRPNEDANLKNWQKLYDGIEGFDVEKEAEKPVTIESGWTDEAALDDEQGTFSKQVKQPYQVHNCYIISQIKSGFLLIDQQAAHERILYEKYLEALKQGDATTQKQLFPKTLNLSVADAEMMREILTEVNGLGFDIQEFGKDAFIIHGAPPEIKNGAEEKTVETLLEQYRQNTDLKLDVKDNIARSMARSASIKKGQELTPTEMQSIINELFACEIPYQSPGGKLCFVTYDLDDLAKQFGGNLSV